MNLYKTVAKKLYILEWGRDYDMQSVETRKDKGIIDLFSFFKDRSHDALTYFSDKGLL